MASGQEREEVARELYDAAMTAHFLRGGTVVEWCDLALIYKLFWLDSADAALSMRDAAVAKALDDAAGRVAAKMCHDRDCFSDSFQRCDCVNDKHNRTIAAAVRAIKEAAK